MSALHAAIKQVMEAVPYVQKDTAKGLTYSFLSEAGLIEKLHPAMADAGLAMIPHRYTILESGDYTTRNGAVMFRVRLLGEFKLTHAAGESFDVCAIGEGSDNGDKGCSKAMTQALKYALRQTFLIETGDDPDREASQEPDPQEWQKRRQQPAPPQQPKPQPERPPQGAAAPPPAGDKPKDRTPAELEADAAKAIKVAKDETRLAQIGKYVTGQTGKAFTSIVAEKLFVKIGDRRRELEAAQSGPTSKPKSLGEIDGENF